MNNEKGPGTPVSYAEQLRLENPEKMAGIENMVRQFSQKVRIEEDPALDNESIAKIANFVVNRIKPKELAGAEPADIQKAIEDALYEGVDSRMHIKKEHLEERPNA